MEFYNEDKKHILSNSVSLISFFENNDIYIPKYQRKYEWSETQWQEFINTICEEEALNTYMGSIILCDSENRNIIDVIDGQQRMITLFIFLLYLYSNFEKNIANMGVRNEEWTTFSAVFQQKLKKFLKIELTQEQNFLTDLINTVYKKNSNNIKNTNKYNKCFNFFKTHSDLKNVDFYDFILYLKKCWIVVIKTTSLSEAIDIFITMNTTGLDLKYSDILKSKILDEVNQDEEKERKIIEIWEEILENCTLTKSADKIDDFLLFFLEIKNEEAISKKIILDKYVKIIKDKRKDILSLVNEIKSVSEIYKNILFPIEEYWKNFYEIVFSIKELNYRALYPLLGYSAFNKKLDTKTLKFIKNIFLTLYRLTTLKKVYGTKPRKFILNCKTYLFKNNLESLYKDDIYQKEINSKVNFNELILNFKFPVSDNLNGAAKFLLRNIYTKLVKSTMFNLFNPNFSLEHILDKKIKLTDLKDNINLNDEEKWLQEWNDEINKSDEVKEYIYKLGNLTLLKDKDNNNLSGKKFNWNLKKKIYWESENKQESSSLFKYEINSPLEKSIDFFNKKNIEDRTQYLVNKIIEFEILKLDKN